MSKGMRVNHDLQDIREGEEIILTLKDQNILDENGEFIDEDILENRELAEKDRREFLNKQSAKEAKNLSLEEKYNEFEKGNILSKYDKVEQKKDGFKLTDDGELMPDTKLQLEQIKKKLKMNPNANILSADGYNKSHNVIAREYEEETEEQKNRKKKGFQKRIKKMEKKQKTKLVDFLEENVDNQQEGDLNHMENHGNREQQAAMRKKENLQEELEDKKKRIDNYESAINEANEQARLAQQKWEIEDDTEQQLLMSIENQRKYQLEKEKEKEKEKERDEESKKFQNESQLLELLQENEEKEKEYQRAKELQAQKIQDSKIAAPKKKLKKNQEYVQEMSLNQEFLKTVDTKKAADNQIKMEQKQTSSLNETKNGTTSIVQVSLPSERQIGRYKRQEELDAQVPDMSVALSAEEIEKLKEENNFLFEKKQGLGLADTLRSLRERGALLESNYDFRGRNLDEKPYEERVTLLEKQQGKNQGDGGVKLEHRDATGRLMTKKEAFRYQCHIFHGQGPSKKTLEKKLRQEIQRETIRQKTSNQDTILMQKFRQQQKSSQNPYVKL